MNVYFFDPSLIEITKLKELLNILKVKRIFILKPDCLGELKACISDLLLYDIKNTGEAIIENDIRSAVYLLLKDIIEIKSFKNNQIVDYHLNDIYRTSRNLNPIYNITNCKDKNLMLFINHEKSGQYVKQFVGYYYNILNKYAKDLPYQERICFIYLQKDLYKNSSIYLKNKWHSAICTKTKYEEKYLSDILVTTMFPDELFIDGRSINHLFFPIGKVKYDPILSFIYYITKLSIHDVSNELSLQKYYFSQSSYDKWLINKITEKFQYEEMIDIDYSSGYEEEPWDIGNELDYINSNGGDWIND